MNEIPRCLILFEESCRTKATRETYRRLLNYFLEWSNKDGDYTKANGNLQLYVQKDGRMVHSATFDVTKDDFASWKNNNGEKITGYSFSLKKYFSSGPHDVLVDFVSGPEKSWIDLHDTFWSIN